MDKQAKGFWKQILLEGLNQRTKLVFRSKWGLKYHQNVILFLSFCFPSCWSPKYWTFTETTQQRNVYAWSHDIIPLYTTYLAILQYRKDNFVDFCSHHHLWVKYFTFRYFPFTLISTLHLKNRSRRCFVDFPTLLTKTNNAKYNFDICWEKKNHVTHLRKFDAGINTFTTWLSLIQQKLGIFWLHMTIKYRWRAI